jgi:uncharacterized protein involved in exopolysaccharide biosynthesis
VFLNTAPLARGEIMANYIDYDVEMARTGHSRPILGRTGAASSALGANFAGARNLNQFQSISEVMAALRRRAFIIALIVFSGSILSVWYALKQEKSYAATAVVQIEDPRVTTEENPSAGNQRRLQLIEQRLMARDNLIRVMDKHELFNDQPDLSATERVHLMRQSASINQIINPTAAYSPAGNPPSGLTITVELSDPVKAAEVANDLMSSVIEQSQTRSELQAQEALSFFADEERRIDAEIAAMDEKIATYKRDHAEQLPSGIAALRTQLADLRNRDLSFDQEIVTLEANSTRTRAEDMTRQIGQIREQKQLIGDRIARIEMLIAGAPDVERTLSQMERELDKLADQASVITRRKADAEMGQALLDRQAGESFQVLETALPPEQPISTSRKALAMMGGIVSVIVAVVVALLFELMNPAIRSAQQMERMLGIQPVVSIPVVATRRDRRIGGARLIGRILALFAALGGLVAGLNFSEKLMQRRPVRG